MKYLLFFTLFISLNCVAEDDCWGEPCPPPPTQAELLHSEYIFEKIRYILGAAFDVHNNQTYRNIPDFVSRTKSLKSDIKNLKSEAERVNSQAGRVIFTIALSEIELCVSFNQKALSYCSQALSSLKNYSWEKEYGNDWSGYPITEEWKGFSNQ